jgi:hypothetical protein
VSGTFPFTVKVTDASGATATQALSLTIAPLTLTLTGLTPSFTISGVPFQTVTTNAAVTMTVTTNSPSGYQVSVQSSSAFLTAPPGNSSKIPIGDLRVRQNDQGTFVPLSTSPTVIHSQTHASAVGVDPIGSEFRITVPFVPPDTYTTTLTYIAATL